MKSHELNSINGKKKSHYDWATWYFVGSPVNGKKHASIKCCGNIDFN